MECNWFTWLKALWQPKPINKPTVDPELPIMNSLQRSAESLRYAAASTEWWMSPTGTLREWLRLNCKVATTLAIPGFLVIPIITFILGQFKTITGFLVAIAANMMVFPIVTLIACAIITGIICLLRFLLGR